MLFTEKFRSTAELNYFFKGGLTVGLNPKSPPQGLVGKTITFSAPAASCTFTQPAASPDGQLTWQDIKSQLETQVAGLKVDALDEKSVFYQSSGSAVALAAVNEPARTLLGFATNKAMAGKVLNAPGGSAPALASIDPDGGSIYVTYTIS